MKPRLEIIALACTAMALCFGLIACTSVNKALYTGTWVLESSDDPTFDAKTMDLMDSLGVQVTLTLNDDGTGTFNVLGNDPHAVTWKATSDTEGELSIDGVSSKIVLADEKLTSTNADGVSMSFVPGEAAPAAEVPSANSPASDASTEAESAGAAGQAGDTAGSASQAAAEEASATAADADGEASEDEEQA